MADPLEPARRGASGTTRGSPRSKVPLDPPTVSRCYDYCLGGKDNVAADRDAVLGILRRFPEGLDIVQDSWLFLYRVVRYLARDAGLDQFIDMGSGLPTDNTAHRVARRFQPAARVVYVDNDPMVLAHGRAELAKDPHTTVVDGDLTTPEAILRDAEVRALIDFDRPVGVLYLSVLPGVIDDATVGSALKSVVRRLAPGSHVALTHFAAEDSALIKEAVAALRRSGLQLRWRLPREIRSFVGGLEPIDPGFVDVARWRPDPDQPSLGAVDAPLRRYLGASRHQKRVVEYGGVVRKSR